MFSDVDVLEFTIKKLKEGKKVALLSIIEKHGSAPRGVGAKMALAEDGEKVGTIGGGVMEREIVLKAFDVIKNGKPAILTLSLGVKAQNAENVIELGSLCGGVVKVYVDIFHPQPRALVIGLGHVGKAIANLLKYLGYYVIGIDTDSKNIASIDFIDMKIFGNINEVLEKTKEVIQVNDIAVVTQGEIEVEYAFVKELIPKVKYVFLLGSRRKAIEFVKRLTKDGLSKDLINERFRCPMGLDIGAETPEEIAVSLVAELILLRKDPSKLSTKPLNIVPEVNIIEQ
jgi:xanthine dehydrogenase accessory factor